MKLLLVYSVIFSVFCYVSAVNECYFCTEKCQDPPETVSCEALGVDESSCYSVTDGDLILKGCISGDVDDYCDIVTQNPDVTECYICIEDLCNPIE